MLLGLVRSADATARAIAERLLSLDDSVVGHTNGPLFVSGTAYLMPPTREASDPDFQQLNQRVDRIVLAMNRDRSSRFRTPDVLALACDSLADPDAPHTVPLVRFAAVLALRAAYGIEYELDTFNSLRKAYDNLAKIMQGPGRRARYTKKSRGSEAVERNFLLDLLCLEGHVARQLNDSTRRAYLKAFSDHLFGIDAETRLRSFGSGRDSPFVRLTGSDLPDFSTLMNFAFGQPLGVPGLDEITGGLIAIFPNQPNSLWTGGLSTYVTGAPGTGKTSLCLTIATRLSEFGSQVRYVSTEEPSQSLQSKQAALANPVSEWLAKYGLASSADNFAIIDGRGLSLKDLACQLRTVFSAAHDTFTENAFDNPRCGRPPINGRLTFPRVLVIDSISALLAGEEGTTAPLDRRELSELLNNLRDLGVCLFLIGGEAELAQLGVMYLVDNVFVLGLDRNSSERHPVRTLNIEKTRLQPSSRGRHVFHISRRRGCTVSPSLHTVLSSFTDREFRITDPVARSVVSVSRKASASQGELFRGSSDERSGSGDLLSGLTLVSLRRGSQILVYGRGPSGKARISLAIALEPHFPVTDRDRWCSYVTRHADPNRALWKEEEEDLARKRVFVLSFLYSKDYYLDIVRAVLENRYRSHGASVYEDAQEKVTVDYFYPGFIDPETLVQRVRTALESARLEGRPYSTVILDGVHNLLLQFPLLQREPLLWPTLYRVFRYECLDTITTFTFFQMEGYGAQHGDHRFGDPVRAADLLGTPATERRRTLLGSEELFFHLLVSSCDYTLVVERARAESAGQNVLVRLASSIDERSSVGTEFLWDPSRLIYSPCPH